MCGILFQYKKQKFSRKDAEKIMASLDLVKHRGPDGEGVMFIDSVSGKKWTLKTNDTPSAIQTDGTLNEFPESQFDVCLGHRRLSIFDLSTAGHQPFTDQNGNIIVFNGEIYNFLEIRNELSALGDKFHTGTDTEVILQAYKRWGPDALKKFNGMFSFVLWDVERSDLFVVNDRFGVKPMYYYQDKDQKIIASEMKQFLPFRVITDFNWDKVKDFLKFGLIDHDLETLLTNIHRFPNSHYSLGKIAAGFSFRSYYETIRTNELAENSKEVKELPSLFEDAVGLRLRADVPWGIGASGGLDSSIVLYTADRLQRKNKLAHRVKTFSAIAPGHKEDESEFIKFIEKDLDIESFYTNPVEKFNSEDFVKHIWHQDAPVLSTSFYAQWNVARLAKESGVTVLLAGQGADETFAGYHHHFYRYCSYLMEKFGFGKLSKEIKGYVDIKQMDEKVIRKIVRDEVKLKFLINAGVKKVENEVIKKRYTFSPTELLYLDFAHAMLPYYLRSDDRTAMAFSIETRHPFLDYRIVDLAFSMKMETKIKNGWQKHILRQAFDYVPDKLRYRKDKKGFTTPRELIEKEIGAKYPVSFKLLEFCKKNNIQTEEIKVDLLSLSIWMNMLDEQKQKFHFERA